MFNHVDTLFLNLSPAKPSYMTLDKLLTNSVLEISFLQTDKIFMKREG